MYFMCCCGAYAVKKEFNCSKPQPAEQALSRAHGDPLAAALENAFSVARFTALSYRLFCVGPGRSMTLS